MECVITTVMFDGQFWAAIIEQINEEYVHTARYVFGSEPGNADLLDFYLNRLDSLSYISGRHTYRVKKKYSENELRRMENKSHTIYKANQEKYLSEHNKLNSAAKKLRAEEKYRQKQSKRKKRKRGH